MKKLLLIILVVLVVLLLGAVLAVHFTLRSDLPRSMVVEEVNRLLGADVGMEALEVGWGGSVTVKDLSLALPLADQPMFTATQVQVQVTPLWLVPISGIEVRRVEVPSATLRVRQRPDGRWNVAELIEAVRGRQRRGGDGKPGWLDLPEVNATNVTVEVIPREGQPVTVSDVSAQLTSSGGAGYAVAVQAPSVARLQGQVARSRPWRHAATFDADVPADLLAALTGRAVEPAKAAGRWEGQFDQGRLSGRFDLEALNLPWLEAVGQGELRLEDGQLTIRPQALQVRPRALPEQTLTLESGAVTWADGQVQGTGVRVQAYGGTFQAGGTYSPATGAGQLAAAWEQLNYPAGFAHDGRVDVTLTGASERGPLEASVVLRTAGRAPFGRFSTQLAIDASGERWTQMDAEVRLNQLWIRRGRRDLDVPPVQAHLTVDAPMLRLSRFRVDGPGGRQDIRGDIRINALEKQWTADVVARDLGDVLGLGLPVDRLEVTAKQANGVITLDQASIEASTIQATATGRYAIGQRDQPLNLTILLDQLAVPSGGELDAPWVETQFLSGRINLTGEVAPLQLSAQGELTVVDLQLREQPVGNVRLRVTGSITEQLIEFTGLAPEFFGSQWAVRMRIDPDPLLVLLAVEAEDVQLSLLRQLLPEAPEMEGLMDLSLAARSPRWSFAEAVATGQLRVDNLRAGPVRVDVATAALRSAAGDDWLHLDDLALQYEQGRMAGSAAVRLEDQNRVQADLALTDWPVALAEAAPISRLQLSGDVEVDLSLDDVRGNGSAQIAAGLYRGDRNVGTLDVQSTLDGTVLTVDKLAGQVLDGPVVGEARLDLADLMQSRGSLAWQNVEITRLEAFASPLQGIAGTLSAQLKLERTDDPRALTPLRLDLSFDAENAAYGQMQLDRGSGVAFIEPGRIVLQDLSIVGVGGELNVWGRFHQRDGEPHFYVDASMSSISLEAITTSFEPVSTAVGELAGRVTLMGRVDEWRAMTGRGSMRLEDSDLGRIPLFSQLFAVTNISLSPRPQGQGSLQFRLADGALRVEDFRYRNRGLSYRLGVTLRDVWGYQQSPIDGFALMSARVLPDIDLLRAINELLITIQGDIWAVQLGGTWSQPSIRVVPLEGLENTVRSFFGGQYQ